MCILVQINVFELGATYTKLVRSLHLEGKLPLVDPAHYIGRFAALLEFGAETQKVAHDATRLVKRFDKDWLRVGRRPSGICGACLLLAARMNNFRRSVEEIVQVVKIADGTIRKRLEEFKNTPSGSLTVQDFRSLWLEEYTDPPAFSRGKEKRLREDQEIIGTQGEKSRSKALPVDDEPHGEDNDTGRMPKKARTESDVAQDENEEMAEHGMFMDATRETNPPAPGSNGAVPDDVDNADESLQLDNESFLGILDTASNAGDPDYQRIAQEVEDRLREGENFVEDIPTQLPSESSSGALAESTGEHRDEPAADPDIEIMVAPSAYHDAHAPEASADVVDTFEDIDDDEVDKYLCTPEEVTRKTRLWVEFNLQYLEALAGKFSFPLHRGAVLKTAAAKALDHQTGVEPKKKVNIVGTFCKCSLKYRS